MITLLRKLFVKDYLNVSDEQVRKNHGVVAAIFGIITNLLLVAMKFGAAILIAYNSNWVFIPIAIIADAVNNTFDVVTSVVTLITFKLAAKPSDKEHPFGHERIEYIASLIVSFLVVTVAVTIFRSSLDKVIQSGVVEYDVLSMIFLAVAALLKLFQAYVNRGMGNVILSPALKATAMDSLLDVLATSTVLVCALLSYFAKLNFLDGYFGMGISLFIFFSGAKNLIESSSPLIGEKNNEELVANLKRLVLKDKNVLGIHDILCHSYGPTKTYVSFHIEIEEKTSLQDAHETADALEGIIKEELKVEATIHVDPIILHDPETDKAKEEVLEIVHRYDQEADVHDFRLIKAKSGKKVSFDVLMPYSKNYSLKTVEDEINQHFAKKGKKYTIYINFDRPY